MQVFLTTFLTEWLIKRIVYLGAKALVTSTKNKLDNQIVYVLGQALELEDADVSYEEFMED